MSVDGDNLNADEQKLIFKFNYFFNAVFILEFIVKIFGLGPISNNIHHILLKQ